MRKNEEFKKVIPSKIFENIALNKPILLGVEGEAKKLVEFYGVGESFEPENKEDLIRAIKDIQKLQNSEKFYSKCQQVLKDFNRPKIAASMLKFIFKS